MKPFLKHSLAFSVPAAAFILVLSPVFADVDPAQVSASSESQDTAADLPSEAPDPSSALSQFPQAETMPALPPAASQPPAGVDPAMNAQQAAMGFPKVMTPQDELMARKFQWWPTDAQPAPYKDTERSGYWWWPNQPGATSAAGPWGNQGYIYVRKIIFDYKTTEGPMKPSLVIKRILKNVKVYFDYDKSALRDDAVDALQKGLYTMRNNPKADVLITGNADVRGSEQYNQKLGEKRASAVQDYLSQNGLAPERIRILSRGKLDALAPVRDIVGMQKDRNAQFMIAEVEEVMIPADKASLFEDRQLEEKQEITGQIRVSTKDYVIQSGDTLWGIAEREYGDGKQWKRLYEFNQDVISNPNRPKKGTRIQIPIE
jgi:outer membrane protein OmpA-like peptidoglycan-associated protein